jgi:sporulation protein YlmC with PRC-barrel domain
MRALVMSLSLISCSVLGQQPEQLSTHLDRYVGLQMTGSDGRLLGVVENFLVTPEGEIKGVIIRSKMFLGAEARTAIPWPDVRPATDGRSLFASMTWTEFYRLPDWKPGSTPELGLLVH